MVEKLVQKIMAPRHFWRDVGFDELSELYVAVLLRATAIGLIGLFIPIYMLRLDYSVDQVAVLAACFFTTRVVADIISGLTTGRFGPKHTMLVGCFLHIVSLGLFVSIPQFGWPLWLLGLFWGMSYSFYFVPFNVDFSKVKHSKHGGKELSYVNIMERTGATLGPIVGGVVATLFGPHVTFYMAIAVLVGSLWPLFRTAEPVRTRQKIDYKNFNVNGHLRDYLSFAFLGLENTLSLFWWPLYLGAFVFVTRAAYANLGLLMSVSVVLSIVVARLIGRSVDRRQGRRLIRVSTALNSLIHITRPFVNGFGGAFGVSVANEVVTVGYRLPFFKGMFDAADDVPGYRIVYLSSIESFASCAKAALWWGLAMLSTLVTGKALFATGFLIAAVTSLLINIERFRALDTPKKL